MVSAPQYAPPNSRNSASIEPSVVRLRAFLCMMLNICVDDGCGVGIAGRVHRRRRSPAGGFGARRRGRRRRLRCICLAPLQ
eukprot:5217255-Pyramimonas_sp.AAC.1